MDQKNVNNSKEQIIGQQPVPIFQGYNVNNQPYSHPVIKATQGNAQPVVVNQVVSVNSQESTSSPYATVCPYCQKNITTNAIRTFNCCTCLLCYCTGLLFYICFQLIRKKDICCYDAIHNCPSCGQTIAAYQSC